MRDEAIVGFVLSHACPLKCNFCCSTREVVGKGRVTRAMMENCMIRFAAEEAVKRFSFTGGEPFLYIADIKAALAAARKAGATQPVHIMTSCHWAQDSDQVRDTLTELHDLGLDILGVSYDHEHAKWVTPEQIGMVCDAAAELDIEVHLDGTFWDEDDKIEALLPELAARPEILTFNHLVADVGRARTNGAWPRRRKIPNEEKFSCGRPGTYSLSIYPDGEVYPCCAGGVQIEGKLSCGNVNRDPPSRILYTALTKFHVRMVKEFGWGILYEFVEREAPELALQLPRFEDVDGVCTLCRDLNLNLGEKLAPIYSKIEQEYARTRAEYEWQDREAKDRWSGRRSVGSQLMTSAELQELIVADRNARLDYLAGVLRIGEAPPPSSERFNGPPVDPSAMRPRSGAPAAGR